MLLYFYKNQRNFELTEALYWRYYFSAFLISFIVLLQFTGTIEALFFAWMLVDAIGFLLLVLCGFCFVIGLLSDKIEQKLGRKI